jgi:hypothetical protein
VTTPPKLPARTRRPLCGPLAVVLAAVPVHAWIAASTELSPDEAYYVASARFGIVPDHPPLVPWVLAVLDRLAWPALELRFRLPAIVMSALVALGIAWLTLDIMHRCAPNERAESSAALLAAVFATWLPIPMAGGFVTTPDAPALLAVVAALDWAASDTPSARRSAATAILVAIGALSKVVVIPVAVLAAAIAPARPGSRRTLERLLWLSPLAIVTPLLIASLKFQVHHAFAPEMAWSAAGVLVAAVATLAGSILLWCPPLVFAGLARIGRLPAIYPATFALVAALLFGSTLVRATPPEPNWWAPAALPVIVAGSIAIGSWRTWCRHACVALAVVPTIVALTHAAHPWLAIPVSIDPTARLHGWRAGDPPLNAPGLGQYGAPAERCIYRSDCDDIRRYIEALRANISRNTPL